MTSGLAICRISSAPSIAPLAFRRALVECCASESLAEHVLVIENRLRLAIRGDDVHADEVDAAAEDGWSVLARDDRRGRLAGRCLRGRLLALRRWRLALLGAANHDDGRDTQRHRSGANPWCTARVRRSLHPECPSWLQTFRPASFSR